MTNADYWAHVSASFVGSAAVVVLFAAIALLAQLVVNRRAKRASEPGEQQHDVEAERDEPIDEGKLRVAVRRSASRSERVPFRDANDWSDSGLSGRELFEKRQAQADAAAVRRGEETQPVRHVLLCDPPMVDGLTLFAYLKHHAPQPSGLAWDSENMGALATVTQALYEGVQRDDLVRHVFDGYDLDVLRRHFVRALMALTKDGLDRRTADALGRSHAHLHIRPEQYDAVIGHFVQALKGALAPRVFDDVLRQLGAADGVVDTLRRRIVTAAGVPS